MDGTVCETNLIPIDLLGEDIEYEMQISSYFDDKSVDIDTFLTKIKAF